MGWGDAEFVAVHFGVGRLQAGEGAGGWLQAQPSLLIFLRCRCMKPPKGSPGTRTLLEQMCTAFVKRRVGGAWCYYRRHMINRLITQQHQYKRQNNEGYHWASILI